MPAPTEPPRSLSRPLLTAALLALAALLAVLSLAAEAQRRGERRAVLAALEAKLPPALAAEEGQRAERWDEPARMRLEIARRLVNRSLEEPAGAAATLPLARRLAAEAFARRPGTWRGPALVGASLYLERALAGDPRVVTEATRWEAPLTRARELAPEAAEPQRFQAMAYLELWSYLPEDRRREARTLLARAFHHGPTFRRLLGPWLDLSLEGTRDREEALAVVPDRADAWRRVGEELAARGDAGGVVEARRRWRDALEGELEEALDEARWLRRRDPWDARHAYLEVVARAPAEARFAPLVERALAEAPAGPALSPFAVPLERWLDWALDLDLVGAPPLSAAALDRLAAQVVDLPVPRAAHAAVAAGDLAAGERLERRSAPLRDPSWGGYLLAKARELERRGQPGEAGAALDRLPPSWRDRPSALAARQRIGGGGEGAAGTAVRWLADDPPRGEMVVEPGTGSLQIQGGTAGRSAPGPALVEVFLDGRLVATPRLRGGDGGTASVKVELPPAGAGAGDGGSDGGSDGGGAEGGDGGGAVGRDGGRDGGGSVPRLHLLEVVPLRGTPFQPLRVVPGDG